MNRAQFTFYRSYYEAIKELPKKEQTAVLLAICAYALDYEEPKLTGTASAIFTLIRPTLDASRKREAGRRSQANRKQTGSKRQANRKGERGGERERGGDRERMLYPQTPKGG